jgi:hypothetical protein
VTASASFRIPAFEYIFFIFVIVGGVKNLKFDVEYFIVVFLFCLPKKETKKGTRK